MFSLICVWINGWVNNYEAGDLRRYHAHYDVIVMRIDFYLTSYHLKCLCVWLRGMNDARMIAINTNAIREKTKHQCNASIYNANNFLLNTCVGIIFIETENYWKSHIFIKPLWMKGQLFTKKQNAFAWIFPGGKIFSPFESWKTALSRPLPTSPVISPPLYLCVNIDIYTWYTYIVKTLNPRPYKWQ